MVLYIVGAVIVALVAGGAGYYLHSRSSRGTTVADGSSGTVPSSTGPSTSTDPSTATDTDESVAPDPGPSDDAVSAPSEDDALAQLEQIATQDASSTPLNGQWVAQLASKTDGSTDPLQTAANGSHTFYAPDILAEYQAIKDGDTTGAQVILLRSSDYGLQNGHHFWVTFALNDFGSGTDVRTWCKQRFPDLSKTERANACTVAKLNPAHD